ncbi:hypothetical protein HC928_26150 [bacterium]|nr:hypothetical protein [bacterium]
MLDILRHETVIVRQPGVVHWHVVVIRRRCAAEQVIREGVIGHKVRLIWWRR